MAVPIAPHAEPIPGYILIEPLGRGGFAEVWKAEAPGGIPKAIKIAIGSLDEVDGNVPAVQELKALNRVKEVHHSFILGLERIDIVQGRLFIVMELADRNLQHRLEECQKQGLAGVPRAELLRYLAEAAEALDLMNGEYQLQHLDIKPANIFLVHRHAKVADFGLVKDLQGRTAAVTSGLTPIYSSPETFNGTVSAYSDQYSLAIVYQELLTGVRPITGKNGRQLAMAHVAGTPNVDPLPPADREIVLRALAKKPEDRFPSCGEFIAALKAASPQIASVQPPPPVSRPALRTPPQVVPPPPTVQPARERPKPLPAPQERKPTPPAASEKAARPSPLGILAAASDDRPAKNLNPRLLPERKPDETLARTPTAGHDEETKPAAAKKQADAERCPKCGARMLDPGAFAWCSACGHSRNLDPKDDVVSPPSSRVIGWQSLVLWGSIGLAGLITAVSILNPTFFESIEWDNLVGPMLAGGLTIAAVIVGYCALQSQGEEPRRPKAKKRKDRARA